MGRIFLSQHIRQMRVTQTPSEQIRSYTLNVGSNPRVLPLNPTPHTLNPPLPAPESRPTPFPSPTTLNPKTSTRKPNKTAQLQAGGNSNPKNIESLQKV